MTRARPRIALAWVAVLALASANRSQAWGTPQEPDEIHARSAAEEDAIARTALGLERSGMHAQAESLLAASPALGGRRGVALQVALGDLHVERREFAAALVHFERAIALAPSDLTPAMRKAQLLARSMPKGSSELTAWGNKCLSRFPVVAEFAYQRVVELASAVDSPRAEYALLSWTHLLASRDRFIAADSLTLPRSGLPQALADLRAYLMYPDSSLSVTSWWRSDPLRRNAIANVALSVGRSRLAKGDPVGAEMCYQAGIVMAQRPDALVGLKATPASRPIAYFGLATELATLYDAHQKLDPKGGKSEAIVTALFHSKSEAYGTNDLDAIQRHHMVLGTIFARRGVWKSNWEPANGVFQIEKALDMAKQRERIAGIQPMAELKALLAVGYERTDKRTKALEMHLMAAAAFLDQDELDAAGEQLAIAQPALVADGAAFKRRHSELGVILESRRLVTKIRQSPPSVVKAQLVEIDAPRHDWLTKDPGAGNAGAGLPRDFLLRQRFKCQSDLSDAAFRAGATASATRFAASAIEVEPGKLGSLVGYADVLRTEKLAAQVGVTVEGGWSLAGPKKPDEGKTWSLSGLNDSGSQCVNFSSDLVTGIKVAEAVANDSELATSELRIRSLNGQLVVEIPSAQAHRKELIVGKLSGFVGARNVVVKK